MKTLFKLLILAIFVGGFTILAYSVQLGGRPRTIAFIVTGVIIIVILFPYKRLFKSNH